MHRVNFLDDEKAVPVRERYAPRRASFGGICSCAAVRDSVVVRSTRVDELPDVLCESPKL